MRLADFILENIEPILVDWVSFARTITPEKDIEILRDHAAKILRASARDMIAPQTEKERSDKSKDDRNEGKESEVLDTASKDHAVERFDLGFDMMQVLSELRALRASVVRLWRESQPEPARQDLDDLTRFNESIDQTMAEAVHFYTERVDETREMFLAILGHDLRNPLAAMRLMGHALGRGKGLDAKSLKMIQGIESTVDQMEGMIIDLLDYAITRMGRRIPIVATEMNLETLCSDVVTDMQAAQPLRTIRGTSHGDLRGTWDSRRLYQVLSNLLSNGIQHGASNTPVDLSVTDEASEVMINVHNEGEPIPPDMLPSVFLPMPRRPRHGRAIRRGSVGLGMYIVFEIVTAHGGSVQVKSSRKAGTDFTVRLPRLPPPGR